MYLGCNSNFMELLNETDRVIAIAPCQRGGGTRKSKRREASWEGWREAKGRGEPSWEARVGRGKLKEIRRAQNNLGGPNHLITNPS